jgi:hypothetical protein
MLFNLARRHICKSVYSRYRGSRWIALQLGEEEKLMRKLKVSKIWIPAFLLAVVMAGCGDSDKNANAANPGDPLTPPTVTFVTPPNGNVGVCPNANPVLITAVFSNAMNPATINTSYLPEAMGVED